MPAQLEDPASPKIHRRSGKPPYPNDSTSLLQNIHPTQFTLRDGTTATLLPFTSHKQLPAPLLAFICDLLNLEIERGDSYPMLDPFPYDQFGQYWFGVFGTAMIRGSIPEVKGIMERAMTAEDAGSASPNLWGELCLGSFYVKPNYPGRSSHCCNAGFVVSDAAKGAGVGRAMGEAYVDWAAKLGYTYSVFNLVYETNVASCRIWDALGFQMIGRVPGCGSLKPYPGRLIDSIIYGKELQPANEVDTRVDQ